jgi:hypothetical protein
VDPDRSQRFANLSRGALAAFAVAMLVAATVVVVLISRPRADEQGADVERGVACPSLFDAARGAGAEASRRAARQAAAAGEHALSVSGELFGAAERAALELGALYESGQPAAADVSRVLADARRACRRLGRWRE